MNILGKTFGKLTVISNANRKGYVTCKCECGNVKDIRATSLTKTFQPTRSCGCLQKQFAENVSCKTLHKNSERQITTNRKFNTNFGSIECPLPKNNTSGHKGVYWKKDKEKWQAYIQVHGKRIHLGYFDKIDDAIKAREEGEELYFKELLEMRDKV